MKKSTFKKTAAIILLISSVLLCSCKKRVKTTIDPVNTDAGTTTALATFPSQPRATNTETLESGVVYKNNGVTVKAEAIDFTDEDTDKVKIKLRITNESEYDLKVSIPKDEDGKNTITVNGKKVQANLMKTLQKPETVVWVEMFWHQLKNDYDIQTIEDIELKLVFSEAYVKDAEPLFATDTIKLTTRKA